MKEIMTGMEYNELATRISSSSNILLDVLRIFPYLPFKYRKAVMTLLRVQERIEDNLSLAQELEGLFDYQIPHIDKRLSIEFSVLIHYIQRLMSSVVHCSILSVFVRCAPVMNQEGFEEMIADAIEKEMVIHTRPDREQRFDYEGLFRIGFHRSHPLHESELFIAPQFSLDFQERIHSWRDEIQGSILYPQYGTKYIGRICDNRLRFLMDSYGFHNERRRLSTFDAMYTYYHTGKQTGGPCEVQYALKYSDVKPRVFYRNGTTSFWSSLYIHEPIDLIMRLFPHTDPRHRYNLRRIVIKSIDTLLMIYDYSCFTSNLAELKYFMMRLSEFCMDIYVYIWDPRDGLVKACLGDIIAEYTAVNCSKMEFDVGEIMESDSPIVRIANLAGLLGVYGNINGSIILHGLSLGHLCKHHSRCTCIGDDALGVFRKPKALSPQKYRHKVVFAINVIGDVAPSKTKGWNPHASSLKRKFRTDNQEIQEKIDGPHISGWHYVKRPFYVADSTIYQGELLDLPLSILFCSSVDKIHTAKKPDIQGCRKNVLASYCTLLDRLKVFPLPETEYEILENYMVTAYTILGMPLEGCLPASKRSPKGIVYHVIPPADSRIFGCDWRSYCWENRDEEYFILDFPEEWDQDDLDFIPKNPPIGFRFRSKMQTSWKFFVDAGLLVRKPRECGVLIGPKDRDRFMSYLEGRPLVYDFVVNDVLPDHWLDACRLNTETSLDLSSMF